MSHYEEPQRLADRISRLKIAAGRAALAALSATFLSLAACGKAPENTAAPAQKQDSASETPSAESPLAKAATRGDLDEVKLRIDQGENVNASDALGRTPLHMAVFYAHPRTAALLIASSADVNARDRVGMTPLHAAVLAGSLQEVQLLLDGKADIKAASETGLTPLHLAAATGQPQLAAFLIERGADVQSKDRDGDTPLSLATKGNHPKSMALLQQSAGKR